MNNYGTHTGSDRDFNDACQPFSSEGACGERGGDRLCCQPQSRHSAQSDAGASNTWDGRGCARTKRRIPPNRYDTLDITDQPGERITNIYRNGKFVDDATVCEISFTTVQHPNTCNGRVRVVGDVREFNNGDIIKIGPTPGNKLVIRGKIIGRDDTRNILIFTISDLITLPKRYIRECIHEGYVTIDVNMSIRDAANTLLKHGINGAPVIDDTNIVGTVTLANITRALTSGLVNQKVWDIMSEEPITVDGDTPISSAVKLFDQNQVNSIVVVVHRKPYGVVFRTDVLRESTIVDEPIIAPSLMSA